MLVTDKQYYMEKAYISKLDLMIKRMQGTDDNIIIIDGDEGQGKTEFTCGTCYYIASKTGRKYDVDNIFFDLDEGIEFASKNRDQIIHFDEGALGMLSIHWWKANQQKFIQFVMMARKKRHFIAICIPKFYRLNQYILEERSIALIHVYSRKNIQKGRFVYFNKNAKERLFHDWKRTHTKKYNKFYTFHGSFVKTMEKIFTKKQCEIYERKKDEAIMSLSQKVANRKTERELSKEIKINLLKNLMKTNPQMKQKEIANVLGCETRTVRNYLKEIGSGKEVNT